MIQIQSDIICLRAPNPSPLTFTGTNTYIVGTDRVTVIDPGPYIESHLDAILALIDGRPVDAIIVTHSHLDHSPLARQLSDRCGAPVVAFGGPMAGRSEVMQTLVGAIGGGRGLIPTLPLIERSSMVKRLVTSALFTRRVIWGTTSVSYMRMCFSRVIT